LRKRAQAALRRGGRAGLLDAALSAEDHVALVAGVDDPDLATT